MHEQRLKEMSIKQLQVQPEVEAHPEGTTQPTTKQRDHPVKARPGASWKDGEQHVVPYNRLGFVFAGLMCCIFLAAIDQVCHLIFSHSCISVLTMLSP